MLTIDDNFGPVLTQDSKTTDCLVCNIVVGPPKLYYSRWLTSGVLVGLQSLQSLTSIDSKPYIVEHNVRECYGSRIDFLKVMFRHNNYMSAVFGSMYGPTR